MRLGCGPRRHPADRDVRGRWQDAAVADNDLPEDLIELRRRFEAADTIQVEQDLAVEIHRHPYWESIPAADRFAARMELLKAARTPADG